ncbi:hypothetical protein KTQ42_01420|uniref:hypothetical protein n=1 Tax=Noviherbaspirillum sp. L7-7A TaxID=2850560 RepID=UPI001C2BF587|nr:hypothetical protein [Noviherbaspirillum sp. L7-7A]MBV0877962.1 hypothetical protein [Noviherbaspirillum sp. L7-7A]
MADTILIPHEDIPCFNSKADRAAITSNGGQRPDFQLHDTGSHHAQMLIRNCGACDSGLWTWRDEWGSTVSPSAMPAAWEWNKIASMVL